MHYDEWTMYFHDKFSVYIWISNWRLQSEKDLAWVCLGAVALSVVQVAVKYLSLSVNRKQRHDANSLLLPPTMPINESEGRHDCFHTSALDCVSEFPEASGSHSNSRCLRDPEDPNDDRSSRGPESPSDFSSPIDPACPNDSRSPRCPESFYDSNSSRGPGSPSDSISPGGPGSPSDSISPRGPESPSDPIGPSGAIIEPEIAVAATDTGAVQSDEVVKENAEMPITAVENKVTNGESLGATSRSTFGGPTPSFCRHIVQTGLHVFQLTLNYGLMLLFMTFNLWLCLALVLGAGLGHWLIAWGDRDRRSGTYTPCRPSLRTKEASSALSLVG
ncbi:hypothetical protein EGW08_018965 [Elysia chlorotica]|uniref:Copper transport protein n=1 Tax=Elysia chlorotica TaxID=188477 RepID=A0A433SVF7_ELYCH|nr:hypothetical protein EGW08_018965 [Elysia chlorotica]